MSTIVADLGTFGNNIDKVTEKIKGLSLEDAKLVMNLAEVDKYTQSCALNNLGFSASAINAANGVNVETGAINADTASKYANLKVTNMLKIAWGKFVAFAMANPWLVAIAGATLAFVGLNKVIDHFTVTSEEAKEKLATTESELESVNQQIEELNTQIKTLESLETPSITDKEDLERLKAENEELRIRQRYLEMQKQNDEKDVSDVAKRDYKAKYTSTSREDIDNRKNALDTPVSPEGIASSYLTGGSTITSSPYAAGQQTSEEYDKLADLIAQYELYSEKKKEAIANDDAEAIEKYNQKLGTVETELMNCRTELQGFADDMALTGDSQDLENVKGDLALIDETLFSAGERLVDYINNTLSDADSEKLTKLAQNGELTADVLKENFSEVDEYLKQNGLTLEDLISILDLFQEEFKNITPDKMSISYEAIATTAETASESVDTLRNSINSVTEAFKEQSENSQISVDTMLSLVEAGYATALQFDATTGACTINRDAMLDLVRAKIENQIRDLEYLQTDIQTKLKEDGITAQESANGFYDLAKAKLASASVEQMLSMEQFNAATAQINALQNAMKNLDKIGKGTYTTNFSSTTKATEDAEKATKEYIDSYMTYMKESLNSGRIDYKTYTKEVSTMLKGMYDKGKIAAKDYHSYTKQMLEVQKDIYDRAISGIAYIIDKEVESLEKQKESIESNYQLKIDSIQSEIDALEEVNKKRQEQILLEKAQYELERARNQKTNLV